ncbi:MAG: flagellar P-ring protein FlgI [Phycisphaeraceae bacterium]|nr:MAG: flagellar P-ring protein FlgI [Phycisphaeraceae bacterium]
MRRWFVILSACFGVCVCAPNAHAVRTLREIARISGQNEYEIQGLGLVIGLPGTGDSGKDLVMARPLAEVLRKQGNEIPSFDDLRNTRSVALVMVTATVPRTGARIGDQLNVTVSTIHSAQSLEGGVLIPAALTSVVRTNEAYAIATGKITIEDLNTPTVGVIANAADMIADVDTTPSIAGSFELILDGPYRGWGVAADVAAEINQQYLLTAARVAEPLAFAKDPNTVRVVVPEPERGNPAFFVGEIMRTDITGALRQLPAQVLCNTRSGIILVTGDVRVSPAVITHQDLTITTTVPAIEPTAANPVRRNQRWVGLETDAREPQSAKLEDLLNAFEQLDVPPKEQIQILQMLHKAGKLHAKLVIDEN